MLIIPRLQRVGQSPAYLTIPLCASHSTGANPVAHILTNLPHAEELFTFSALICNDPRSFSTLITVQCSR